MAPRQGLERAKSQTQLNSFETEAGDCLTNLRLSYCLDLPFSKRESVVAMQGWNKVLAFKTAFEEALLCKWRILVAQHEFEERYKHSHNHHHDINGEMKIVEMKISEQDADEEKSDLARKSLSTAWDQVENNKDPLAECLGQRLYDAEELLSLLIDGSVRSLCPKTQLVAREAYRPIHDDIHICTSSEQNEAFVMHLECKSLDETFHLFARCGVEPHHWVLFCDAFVWAMKTHVPYAEDFDNDELDKPKKENAYARFVAGQIAVPAINTSLSLRKSFEQPIFRKGVVRFWRRVNSGAEAQALIGETFYRNLLSNHPELLDYFATADMDSLAIHLVMALDFCVDSIPKVGQARTKFREVLEHLGEMHRKLGIPTYSYALVGGQLLDTLHAFFKEEEELMKEDDDFPVTANELEKAFAILYGEILSFTHHPMLREEKVIAQAEDFYEQVAEELKWSPARLSKRLLEVRLEIAAKGTYSHTSQELELGARLAWRNSAKCVGRIAWNTLMVRDCRHMNKPAEIFKDVGEHMNIATGGTNIQSVMTVYSPREKKNFGLRFWNSQYVRYAGYKDEETGDIVGDPANLKFTEYLIQNGLWTPPETKSKFDVLPILLKIPEHDKPYVYQLPKEAVHEVDIEHPKNPEISKLGLRWATVPAITNFSMNLGGVDYQCCPFNGWFLSTEIVRNLMERYNVGPDFAAIMGIDMKEEMWQQKVACEIEQAVLHSFRKKMYTVVDPGTVSKSFCAHVRREREQFGRECPAQWSWVGGLNGPTNVTWHMEMRDFRIAPQYEYCAEFFLLWDSIHDGSDSDELDRSKHSQMSCVSVEDTEAISVVIAFGSETGNAEAVALRLARSLHLLRPIVICLNDIAGLEVIEQEKITHLLVVCSTFGKGSAPQNAQLFFDTKIAPNTLTNTQYAVLALGSTLYPDFCKAGVVLNSMLEKAGGNRMMPIEKADFATGSEGSISSWSDLVKRLVLPPHLEAELIARYGGDKAVSMIVHRMKWLDSSIDDDCSSLKMFERPENDSCECILNEELLEGGDIASRSTRQIIFRLPEGVTYQTGDHLCVYPLNDLKKVKRFAECFSGELLVESTSALSDEDLLNARLNQKFSVQALEHGMTQNATLSFKTPATLSDVLQAHVDLSLQTSKVPDLVAVLDNCLKRAMKSDEDSEDTFMQNPTYVQYCDTVRNILKGNDDEKTDATNAVTDRYPTIVDFLEEFSSLFFDTYLRKRSTGQFVDTPILPLAEILSVLPRLQPRYYSISSSSQINPQQVSITVGVVHATTRYGSKIEGVCSNYLARLRPGIDRVKLAVRESSFRAPPDVAAPVMMVGPGTGLAPMMGFLEDRAIALQAMIESSEESKEASKQEGAQGHLFFGCRTEADMLYKDKIHQYEQDDVVNLHVALSRAPDRPKMYVQDSIKSMGKEISNLLLDQNAHYYICGDARMADEVYEVCIEVLRKHNRMSRVAAVQHLKRMRVEDRWQFDLWGIVHQFQESRDAVAAMKKKAAKVWLSRFDQDD